MQIFRHVGSTCAVVICTRSWAPLRQPTLHFGIFNVKTTSVMVLYRFYSVDSDCIASHSERSV